MKVKKKEKQMDEGGGLLLFGDHLDIQAVAEMFDCQIEIYTLFPNNKNRQGVRFFYDRSFTFPTDPTAHFYPHMISKTQQAALPTVRLLYSKNRQYDSLWLMKKGVRTDVTQPNSKGGLLGYQQIDGAVLTEREEESREKKKKIKT